MKSILDGRPGLKAVIDQIAEVTGYLWQKGWAERNGGNITVNITEFVDDEMRSMPAIAPVKQIGKTLPYLHGKYFYAKGTGKLHRLDIQVHTAYPPDRARRDVTHTPFP